MLKAVVQITSEVVVAITVVDFIFDAVVRENIVSSIRKMIRKTDNAFEAVKSQKRVTYFSIVFKLLSLFLLVFAMLYLDLSWVESIVYILAMSIFIANITVLLNKAVE